MKKNLWMLGMAVAALTSCTQSEVMDIPESRAISFGTFVDKASRVTDELVNDITAGTINQFNVLGYNATYKANGGYTSDDFTCIFNDVPVTKGTNGWTYTDTQYWHTGKLYRFAAYSDGQKSTSTLENSTIDVVYNPVSAEGAPDNIVFNNYESDGTKDLVAAISGDVSTNQGKPTGPVNFDFQHMLAKIVFDFAATSAVDNSQVGISDIVLSNIATDGTGIMKYVSGRNTVDWTEGTQNYQYEPQESFKLAAPVNSELKSEYIVFYVIPQALKAATSTTTDGVVTSVPGSQVSFKVANYLSGSNTPVNNEYHNHTFDLIVGDNNSWEPGLVYHYTLRFGSEADIVPIQFGVSSVSIWPAGDGGSISLLAPGIAHTEE